MTARVKIGRVRMKNGGTVIVPMPSNLPSGHTVEMARAWFRDVMSEKRAPDAICAVAIWLLPEQPGYPRLAIRYASGSSAILTATLPEIMAGYAKDEIVGNQVENYIMRNLGYRPVDDPDDSA